MPQLDIVTYVTQYMWVLVVLLLLFSLIVLGILPRLQQQLGLRAWAEDGLIESNEEQVERSNVNINGVQSKSLDLSKGDLIGVFRVLCSIN